MDKTSHKAEFTHRTIDEVPRALPDVPPGEHYRPIDVRRSGEGLATSLAWISLGLGLAQVIVPGAVAQLIGMRPGSRNRSTIRAIGVRELTSGIGLLTQRRQADWLWSRVAGDVMDVALLGSALGSRKTDGQRAGLALAAVVGLTAVDVIAAQRVAKRTGTMFSEPERQDGHRPGAGGNDRFDEHSLVGEDSLRGDRSSARAGENGEPARARKRSGVRRDTNVITVNRSVEDVYTFWRDFENLPRFMRHLVSVETLEGGRSHWKAMAPAGTTVEWDAEITKDVPNELIAWRSLPDADVRNSGSVRFTKAPGDRGTEVRVELEYAPPAGKVGTIVAKLFREEPGQQIHDDLRAFKQVMEIGEVVISDATKRKGMHPAQPSTEPVETNV